MPEKQPDLIDARRSQIIEGAISVLLEKGVTASSMNDFIKASGLSKGGVYHHFPSKEELMVGVINHFFEQYLEQVELPPEDVESAYPLLKGMIESHREMLGQLGQLNQLMMDLFANAIHLKSVRSVFQSQYVRFQGMIAAVIQKGIELEEFHPTVDAKAIASGIIGIFDGIGLALMVAPDSVDFPEYAVISCLAIVEGIRIQNQSHWV